MNDMNTSIIVKTALARNEIINIPIIDMHGHWGPIHEFYLPSAESEKMLRTVKRTNIKHIVCSSHKALLIDSYLGNKELEQYLIRHPDILSGYWAVNPHKDIDCEKVICDYEKSTGFVGLKLVPDYHTYKADGERYRPFLEYADSNQLLVLVHTWGDSSFNGPENFRNIVRKYMNAKFIMGHSCYGNWEEAVEIARNFDNVFLDLTAVYVAHDFKVLPHGSGTPVPLKSTLHVNGIIEYMVKKVSSEKIFFGSDLPWYSPLYVAGAILFSKISDNDRENILYKNAEKIIPVDVKIE